MNNSIFLQKSQYDYIKRLPYIISVSYTHLILHLLARNPGRVFSKEQIYDIVWKESYSGDYNIIMSHIRNIREKIEDNPSKPIYIQTVWGAGYRFNKNLTGQNRAIKKQNLSCSFYLQRQGQKGDRSTLQKSKRIRTVSQAVLLNQEKAPHFVFLGRNIKKGAIRNGFRK